MNAQNPFEYEAANNLRPEDIIDYYIEDFNFSRFRQSTKNIFLIGERGHCYIILFPFNMRLERKRVGFHLKK